MKARLEYIEMKSEHLLSLLKNDQHSNHGSQAFIFLLLLFVASNAVHFLKFGFAPIHAVGFTVLACLIIIGRIQYQKAIKENIASANYDAYKDVDEKTFLRTKLQYIHTGIDIKYTRTNIIRFMFVCLFPFLMVLIKEIFQGQLEVTSILGYFLFAVLLGSIFWWFYFFNELERLEISKEDIEGYLESI